MNILNDITEQQQRDHDLYFIEDGEKGFSPEYNKMVIERTIRKTNETRLKKRKAYLDALGERSDAVATYLKSRVAETDQPLEQYFGKKLLAELRGQKILKVLQGERVMGRKNNFYLPGN